MSIFFKARGTNSIGLFLIRLVLGTYTLILGIQQASNIEGYINRVKALNMLDPNLSFIIGFVVPFILILFGALYIIGFFTPITSFILALTMLFKVAIRGFFPSEGIPFNKDFILFTCFLITLFAGAGVISFDALLDRKKKRVIVPPVEERPRVVTAEIRDTPVVEKPIPPVPPPPPENMP
ncbi:MAG: DoxX family protein [Ignavibacteriae bacterium]|nr:MAG: DoxX family protein [Ignavibacteriota bacterium]